MPASYDQDYFSWTQEQARFLKERRFDMLDLDHLAEEIEDMGRSQRRELSSRLAVIIGHLLKLQLQTNRTLSNEKSWRRSVVDQRHALAVHLKENPRLKDPQQLETAMLFAWVDGLRLAMRETGMDPDVFPEACPFTLDQLLDPDFWP